MKASLLFCLLFVWLNLVICENLYPALRTHQIPVLKNGNITVVSYTETASPVPLLPRNSKRKRSKKTQQSRKFVENPSSKMVLMP